LYHRIGETPNGARASVSGAGGFGTTVPATQEEFVIDNFSCLKSSNLFP
jgi:hypothetical protein